MDPRNHQDTADTNIVIEIQPSESNDQDEQRPIQQEQPKSSLSPLHLNPNEKSNQLIRLSQNSIISLEIIRSKMRKNAHRFFNRPKGILAQTFRYISLVCIPVYALLTCLETVPDFMDNTETSLLLDYTFPIEIFINIWWIIELVGRFYACPHRSRFFLQYSNIIDLLSLLPFPIIFLSERTAANILSQVAIILRLLKFTRFIGFSPGIRVGIRAIKKSHEAVYMLLLYLISLLIFTSTAMYWAERGEWNPEKRYWVRPDGSRSPFNSIPEGFYWSLTTLATVGYGDVVPITPVGKFIACITMFFSIMTIALPTSILGSNFMQEWQIHERALLQRKLRDKNHLHRQHENQKDSVTHEQHHGSNSTKAKYLEEQNTIMLTHIAEVQEKLNDISPPQYYAKFKDLQRKYDMERAKISHLEDEIQHLKRILQSQNHRPNTGDEKTDRISPTNGHHPLRILQSIYKKTHHNDNASENSKDTEVHHSFQKLTKKFKERIIKTSTSKEKHGFILSFANEKALKLESAKDFVEPEKLRRSKSLPNFLGDFTTVHCRRYSLPETIRKIHSLPAVILDATELNVADTKKTTKKKPTKRRP